MLGSFAQAQRQQLQASLQRTLPCKHLFPRSAPNRHRIAILTVTTTAVPNPPSSSNTTPEPQQTIAYVSDQTPPQNSPQRRQWNKSDVGAKQRNNGDRGKGAIPVELVAIIDNHAKYGGDIDKLLSYMQSVPMSNALLKRLRDRNQARDLAVKLAESSTPYRAMRLIDIASTLGTNLKQNTYEGVAHQYAQKREWVLILSLATMGLRRTGRTTTRLLNWKTRALVETSKFGLLDGVLEQFRGAGLKPNAMTFQLLITGHIRNKDLTRARSCITLMKEHGFEVDASTHALIASAYRQLGPDKEVQRTALESLRDLGGEQATAALNGLIRLSLDARDTSTALHYLSLFDDPKYLVRKGPQHQPPLGGSSPSHSFRPDSATFTMLIKHVTNENGPDLLDKISSLILKMRTVKATPNSTVAAATVRALCTAGDVHSALEIVARVCQQTTKFETLVNRILLFGRVPKVISLDKDHVSFISRWAELDVHLFNALISGVSGWLGINAVRGILQLMETSKVTPDSGTVEAIISWFNMTERSHPRTLVRTLKKLLSPPNRPNPSLCHAVIASLTRRERTWAANGTAAPLPPPPSPRTDPSSAAGPLPILAGEEVPQKLGYRGMTRFIVQSLFAHRIQSDRFTFAQRMKRTAMCGDVSATKSYFRAMLKRGMHPTAHHYAALMEAHTNAGMMDRAETILHLAMQTGIKPNVKLFTILIAGYGRQRKPIPARRVFEDMVRRGVEPDLVAVHAVSSAYYKAGLLELARAFLVEKWKSVAPVPFYRSLETVPFVDLAKVHRRLHEKKPIWSKHRVRDGRGNKAHRMVLRWKMKRVWDAWQRAVTPRRRLRKRRRARSPAGG